MSKRSMVTLLTAVIGLFASAVPAVAEVNTTPEGNHDGFEGTVSLFECASNGWAVDPDDRFADLSVRIFADGDQVASGVADDFRQDLVEAGVSPDGFSSWFIPLGDVLTFDVPHTISAQARDAQTLEWVDIGLPKQLTCVEERVASGATHLEFTGFVTAFNPCNGEFVSGSVTTRITYHETVNANGTHVMVRVNMHGGDLVGAFGNGYRVSLAANAQFDSIQGTYVFDHESLEWIGLGQTPDFTFYDSVQRIFVSNGQPTGHNFSFASAAVCKQHA